MAWEKVKLGSFCEVASSKRFHLSDRSDSGVPFYCSKQIIQKVKGETVSDFDYIREEFYEDVKKRFGVPEKGDLLITTRGSYGVPYIYRETDRFYFADGNLTWLKNFNGNVSVEFLYYWIQSYEGQKKIDALAKGTAQKAVTIDAIRNLEISLPPLKTQQKIVDILSAYDDLIENNQKQIKLLEEAAQRLYKQWFIDLKFSGHETTKIVDGLPEGWKKKIVMDFISQEIGGGWGEDDIDQKSSRPAFVIRGADIDGVNHGDFLNIPFRFHSESNLEQRILQDGDIVFEVSGGSKTEGVAKTLLITTRLLEQYSSPVICASFCKKIRPKEGLSQYFYDALQYMRMSGVTSEYDKKSASSIVNYRWKDFLSQQCLMLPSENILRMYDKIAKPIYKSIQTKSIEIEKLKRARNSLLPKLMSGEIEM